MMWMRLFPLQYHSNRSNSPAGYAVHGPGPGLSQSIAEAQPEALAGHTSLAGTV